MSERKANEAACRASEGTENCPQLLHAWFEAAVRSHGDSLAIDIPIDDTNRTSLDTCPRPTRVTYKQLDLMANRMSARIAHLFPTADCVAALAMPRASVYTYACQLAVLKCGGAFTTFDPKFPPERRKYIMTDSACVCVFHDPESDFGAIELEALPPLLAAEIATRVIDVAEVFVVATTTTWILRPSWRPRSTSRRAPSRTSSTLQAPLVRACGYSLGHRASM